MKHPGSMCQHLAVFFPFLFPFFLFSALSVSSVFSSILPYPAHAQEQPADASEVTRALLLDSVLRIEVFSPGKSGDVAQFLGSHFIASFDSASRQWQFKLHSTKFPPPADARRRKWKSAPTGGEYEFLSKSDDDRATLEIRRADQAEPVLTAVLWTREQIASAWLPLLRKEKPGVTARALADDIEVAYPEILGFAEDANSVWIVIGHSTGESELGLGTVVHFFPAEKRSRTFQPAELATCAVTGVTLAGGAVWVASRRQNEGRIAPCAGLTRLDPETGAARSFLPRKGPFPGSVISALAGLSTALFLATDTGLCAVKLPEESWSCARIVPQVHLTAETPVSNLPGDKPSGQLAAGDYEVLWANAGFLELATKDSLDAWLAEDDFKDLTARHFDAEPYKLLNTSSGGPAPVRLLSKPGADPLGGALLLRVPLEKLPTPQGTPPGWVRVRAHFGWISRGELQVTPVLQPLSGKESP